MLFRASYGEIVCKLKEKEEMPVKNVTAVSRGDSRRIGGGLSRLNERLRDSVRHQGWQRSEGTGTRFG